MLLIFPQIHPFYSFSAFLQKFDWIFSINLSWKLQILLPTLCRLQLNSSIEVLILHVAYYISKFSIVWGRRHGWLSGLNSPLHSSIFNVPFTFIVILRPLLIYSKSGSFLIISTLFCFCHRLGVRFH